MDARVASVLSACPHPEKRRYLDEATAERQASSLRGRGPKRRVKPARAYRCRCGFFHVTTSGM